MYSIHGDDCSKYLVFNPDVKEYYYYFNRRREIMFAVSDESFNDLDISRCCFHPILVSPHKGSIFASYEQQQR